MLDVRFQYNFVILIKTPEKSVWWWVSKKLFKCNLE